MIDIKDLGTFYHAVDLTSGTAVTVQIIYIDEIMETISGLDVDEITGFFKSPFHLTYYKPTKGTLRKDVVQDAILQALLEGNRAVLIDSA